MNRTSSFFISDEDEASNEPEAPSYTRRIFKMPETPSVRPKIPSKFIKKWSEYVDDAAVQKSVDPTNGDVNLSLPMVKVNLTPLLRINIDLNYIANKDGVHFEIPLTRNFISVDYHKSVFNNDATFFLNSMGSKMPLESVGLNKFKMIEDIKGEVDVTFYKSQNYFVVESDIEKIIYGTYGNTGTTLYELSYQNWRETGNDPQNLIKIPVAWFIAERHSKVDGKSIYYHYENVEARHILNPNVSYTSEVMLKKISDGNEVKIEFEYGNKETSENEDLKLKDDDGNLRMGNFLVEKHFLSTIKVETENYEQDFEFSYDLFDGKKRILKGITQLMHDGTKQEVLKFKNEKIFEQFLPTEIGIIRGAATKLTYTNQVVPMPQLEKKFLLKNRPVVTYGTNTLLFSSIIDNRVILKIFDIKTFKLVKEFLVFDQKTILESSLQANLGHNFLVIAYKTDDSNHIKIYHQNDQKKWDDTPAMFTFNKDSKVYTTSHDFIVVHDGYNLVVIQKIWNEKKWLKYNFQINDSKMKIFIRGKSVFLRERSNVHVVFKNDDQKWNLKLLKSGITPTANIIADSFNVNDDVKDFIKKSLYNNEVKVMNNVVILSNLKLLSTGQLRTVFDFITVGDGYEIKKEEQLYEDHENIYNLSKTLENEGTSVVIKYRKIGSKYELKVVDMHGKIDEEIRKNIGSDRNRQIEAKNNVINDYNTNADFAKSMKTQFLPNWKKYYPLMESGSNDLFFAENIQFRMTGAKWTKFQHENKRNIKLGEYFTLIFDNDDPEVVKLVSQKDDSVKIDMRLYQSNKLLNFYPYYIAYQSDRVITKLIIFDDGKSITKHETFRKEELMLESNQGYFMTIKKSEDLSHSEPYELIVRNIVQYLPEKPQPVIETVELSKQTSSSDPQEDSNKRITKYERTFKVDKKLWTSTVKIMNGHTKEENGWIESFVTRSDEADIKQTTSYYDSDSKLLKSDTKSEQNSDDKDYSDNLLYDVSGTLQVSNFLPYKKSEDSFGYFGFEDYEENEGWSFKSQRVIKNDFAFTGKNFLRLDNNETFQKSFIPKNKEEIFIAAAWIRSNSLKLEEYLENFKALISFSIDGSNFTELFGILGSVKHRNGEWFNVEVAVDFPNTIRMSYEDHRAKNPQNPDFNATKFKVTLMVNGIENSQVDVDNVAFHPAPHRLDVNVYNENQDITAIIHNEGQITRLFYDNISSKEIGRTKKNGDLEKLLIHSEGDKDSPKTITKFSVTSGFHENIDKIFFTNRWKMSSVRSWKVLPLELMHVSEDSDGWMEVRDEKIIDEKSAAFRAEISLDSVKKSKFEVKFTNDSVKFKSDGGNKVELKVNNKKISEIPKHFELAIYKYETRTIIWINGVVTFDEVLNDSWRGFSLQFNGKISLKNIFILNNPKVEILYHNSFNEKEQEIKLESMNSAIVTQYIYDEVGREILRTKATRITQPPTNSLLKFHKNFIKSFDPQTGRIEGDVVTENPGDEGFPYYHTIFYKNPLNEKQKVGQPGKQFSHQSTFVTTYDKNTDFPFINAYFPDDEGFTKHVENLANESKRILVYDKSGNKIAKYVQVPNFDDALITYEYDDEGRILKVLSPEYHVAVKTVLKINEIWKSGEAGLSDKEKELQDQLGIHFKYDKRGNLIEKMTPDIGRQVFLYNSMNLLKFSITYNADPPDGQTIYYNYDSAGGLTETGHITRPVSVEYLKKFLESNFHTQAIEFQKIQFNEGKSKIIETINHETTVLEEIQFDENEEDKIVSRKLTIPTLTDSLQTTFDVKTKYIGDKVEVLTYPTTDEGKILKVKHTYNGIGQLIGIGTIEQPFCFAKFTYDAFGQPITESNELNNVNRKYSYTSPGYMNKIDDEFLTQDISYIDGGYGQLGYGDGIVMKTAFHAKWSDKFFKKLDEGKVDESNEERQEFNYDDGVFEEDEERRAKRAVMAFDSDSSRAKTGNSRKVRLVLDESLEFSYPESIEIENNENRRIKLEEMFKNDQNTEILRSSSSNIDGISSFGKSKIESIQNSKNIPKFASKLEQTLQNFNGFTNNNVDDSGYEESDKISDSEDTNTSTKDVNLEEEISEFERRPNPKNILFHQENTLLNQKTSSTTQNLKVNPKSNDNLVASKSTTSKIIFSTDASKRSKRSSSISTLHSPQNRNSSVKPSRQSKIDNVMSNIEDDSCISALKNSNFLSENSFRFKKLLNTKGEVDLPLKCYDDNIYNEISAKNQIPTYYGHRFTYGTHRELVKAKYFSTKVEEQADPLQMHTFHDKVPGIAFYKSHNIFNILREGNFISVDQRRDEKVSSIGTRGTASLLRDDDLIKLLKDLGTNDDYDYMEVLGVIKQLILHTIETKKIVKIQDFEKIFLNWKSAGTGTFRTQLEKFKAQAKKLHAGLVQQQLLPTSSNTFVNPINKKLVNDLRSYTKPQIVEIVAVLSNSFNSQLLTTAFDTASYEIDANGNHKKFSIGFENVKLDYQQNTSKLKNLEVKGQKFSVDHDGYGNMTSAPHKGVKKIIYHPVSRRVMEVLLTNGGSIKFHYNSQGERILKQTFNEKYEITNEVFYLRDENGNVLMDRVMKFNLEDKTCVEIVTHYIYGPRGMIGFIRDDKFNSIFTDHSGSVRLVIREGEVVAAYDYLPYGEMMRKFVTDESADIRYLYHGKELDEETSTYNFHARFYDPTIGRFLQTDPQSQYFSPYKFSGNSPVSFVDPDGEFVFIIAVVALGVGGAYLGAAAHNKSWNPAKWNFKDPGTYLAGALGGVTGALLPFSVGTAIAAYGIKVTVGVMVTTSYLFAAASNNSWNPIKWNFKEPGTYYALFSGAGAGASAVGGFKELAKFAGELSLKGKVILFTFVGTAVYAGAAGANKGNMKFWEWDFENPNTIKGMFEGFTTVSDFTLKNQSLKKLIKNPSSYEGKFKNLGQKLFKKLGKIVKDPNHPLFKVLGGVAAGYLIISKYKDDFNPLNWVNDAGTYSATFKAIRSIDDFAITLSLLTTAVIKAKRSKDWNRVASAGQRIKSDYSRTKKNLIGVKAQGVDQLVRHNFKGGQSVFLHRVDTLQQLIKNEDKMIQEKMMRRNEIWLDRSTNILSPCGGQQRASSGFCRSTTPKWNGLKQKFKSRDFGDVFESIAIVVSAQRIGSGTFGYATLVEPKGNSNEVRPDKLGTILISNEPKPSSEPGMHLKADAKIEIDLQNSENADPLIVTDQNQGTTIFTREHSGKLEIYHHQEEPETKIAFTIKNDATILFYDTVEREEIEELTGVKTPRLFDRNNNEIKKNHGNFEIPDDGVLKFVKNGEFKILKSIHGTPIREIVKKNKRNHQKNARKLSQNFPNFEENCDTCKSIHFDDYLPDGAIDSSYKLDIDKELKSTVVIYKDNQDSWKLSSQLIQVDTKTQGKPEIAEIRSSPKVFDLKLSEDSDEQGDVRTLRKRRNAENFIPENIKNSTKNYNFIENSTQNFNRSTPSVLQLGDFWLNATDFNSNLTLAYAFLKKLTNETLFSTNEGNMPKISEVEFEIFANDLLNEFTENLTKFSIKCGIPTVMREILSETNLQKISNEVKRKCEKNLTEKIAKYLLREILEKNEGKIIGKSSKKQFEKLKKLMIEKQGEFLDMLLKRNEKLYVKN